MPDTSHIKSECKYVVAFMAQEVLASEGDAHEFQRQLHSYVIHTHAYGGLHLVTVIGNELATRLYDITKCDRWFDTSLKMQRRYTPSTHT